MNNKNHFVYFVRWSGRSYVGSSHLHVCVRVCVWFSHLLLCMHFLLSNFIHYFLFRSFVWTEIVLAMHTPDDFEHRKFFKLYRIFGSLIDVFFLSFFRLPPPLLLCSLHRLHTSLKGSPATANDELMCGKFPENVSADEIKEHIN